MRFVNWYIIASRIVFQVGRDIASRAYSSLYEPESRRDSRLYVTTRHVLGLVDGGYAQVPRT